MPSPIATATNQIVARPIAQMDASGTAALTTLQTVVVSVPYDDMYEVTLSALDAEKLAKAFKLDGSGSDFTCTLHTPADFIDVLNRNMRAATCTEWNSAKSTSSSIAKVLHEALKDEMSDSFRRIYEDILANILESDWDVSCNVGWESGATNMSTALNALECELIAQQFSQAHYAAYMDASENYLPTALPILGGDKLVFVFNVTNAAVAKRSIAKTGGREQDANTASPVTGGSAGAGSSTANDNTAEYGNNTEVVDAEYSSTTRLVAFRFTLPAGTNGDLFSLA